ncbi:DUF982 domain-containing protein [Mesorhizobium sp. M1060]|uniref:DUF982 domain-containing protein n=1 Tax=unclassified Mesorhizobium TaxID=325217 RepID=UPI0003CF02DC|nr:MULTISPECIES: DUF982 domain-containing protein [unclassified Mesorhizobium]ESX44951.1 hypothetical protein X764_03650 [Mesorhizobium sp. LSHC440A00]WJI59307.1 DUF982 domain-containing protein [Mesorhizobium sp. C432A]
MANYVGGVPIKIAHGVRVIETHADMADVLTNGEWPSDGPKFLAALAALVEARIGRCSDSRVRIAFIEAAMEADLLPDSFMQN